MQHRWGQIKGIKVESNSTAATNGKQPSNQVLATGLRDQIRVMQIFVLQSERNASIQEVVLVLDSTVVVVATDKTANRSDFSSTRIGVHVG